MARKTHSSPEQAKQVILDAAEAVMIDVGPAGLRISAVAKKAGMAHPNIIYHFGSRDGLISAISERVGLRATQRITQAITEATNAKPEDRVGAMTQVLDVAYAGDQGRVAVWLHMSGAESSFKENMQRIVELSHSLRRSIDPDAKLESTERLVLLVTLALVGEVVSGDGVKEALGFDGSKGSRAHFRQWLAEILLNLSNEQWSTSFDRSGD